MHNDILFILSMNENWISYIKLIAKQELSNIYNLR